MAKYWKIILISGHTASELQFTIAENKSHRDMQRID